MSTSTRKSPYPNPMALFESMMPSTGLDASAMKPFSEAGSTLARGMAGVQEELASFLHTRLKHDAELSQSLCGCKNWQEAMDLQQDWIREAVQEYSRATQTFASLGTRMMTDYWSQVGAATSKAAAGASKKS